MYYFLKVLLYIPLLILFPTIRVGGRIPKGKLVLICNHRSNLDAFVIHNLLWCKPRMIGKTELKKSAYYPILKLAGTIFVNREKIEISSIKLCMKTLNDNKKLFIFPEGTRSKVDNKDFQEIKNGVVMFAVKCKSQILPIYLKHKPRLFSFNKLVIGKPFALEEYYEKKLSHESIEECGNIISEKLAEITNID